MDLGNISNSTNIAVSFFQEISPVVYLLLGIVLVPFILELLFNLMGGGEIKITAKEQDAEIKNYGRKLSKKERKEVAGYLEKERYQKALKK